MDIKSQNLREGFTFYAKAEGARDSFGGANTDSIIKNLPAGGLLKSGSQNNDRTPTETVIERVRSFWLHNEGIDTVSLGKRDGLNLREAVIKDAVELVPEKSIKDTSRFLSDAVKANQPEQPFGFQYDPETGQIGSFEKPSKSAKVINRQQHDKDLWLHHHSETVELTFTKDGQIKKVTFVDNEKADKAGSLTKQQILVMANIARHNRKTNSKVLIKPVAYLRADLSPLGKIDDESFWQSISVVK